jgi:hypothetical protein
VVQICANVNPVISLSVMAEGSAAGQGVLPPPKHQACLVGAVEQLIKYTGQQAADTDGHEIMPVVNQLLSASSDQRAGFDRAVEDGDVTKHRQEQGPTGAVLERLIGRSRINMCSLRTHSD